MQKVGPLKAIKACLKIVNYYWLLSALNASESIKENENNFDDTESTRNEDYNANKILKTTIFDPVKINKTIREIRKENYDDDKKTWTWKKITISQ